MNEAEKRVKILEVFHDTVCLNFPNARIIVASSAAMFPFPRRASTLTRGQKDFFTVRSGPIWNKQAQYPRVI